MRDYRLHVSMDLEREMGKDGLLFGTSGLEFTHPGEKEQRLHGARRLALALDVERYRTWNDASSRRCEFGG